MQKLRDILTSSTPGHGEPPQSVGSGAGADSMPANLGAVAPGGGEGGAQAGVEQTGKEPAAAQPRSPLVDAVLGNIAEGPFTFVAFKTGHDHWLLAPEERALMSEAAGAVAAQHGLLLNPQTNPWGCLVLGYVGFGLPRLVEEIRLLRLEMAKRNKEKAPEAPKA